jgi:hypothetical protein
MFNHNPVGNLVNISEVISDTSMNVYVESANLFSPAELVSKVKTAPFPAAVR